MRVTWSCCICGRRFGLFAQGGLFALSALEKVRLQSDLSILGFAQAQLGLLEEGFKSVAAADNRLPSYRTSA